MMSGKGLRRAGWRGVLSLVCCLMSSISQGAAAQSTAQWGIAGSFRAGLWSHSRDLDDAGPVKTAGLWMRATGRIDAENTLVADAWMQSAQGLSDAHHQDPVVRELFWKRRVGDLDVKVGRMLLGWGRADSINPTDSIGRRKFMQLTTEDDDQREGSDAIAAKYFVNDAYSVQAIWLPTFRGDIIPLRGQPMQIVSTVAPDHRSQYAFKLDHTSGVVDWSMSYFDGYDRMPDLSIKGLDASGTQILLSHHRVRRVGADFTSNFEGGVLRGEVAWSQHDTGSVSEGFFRKRSQLLAVLGGDKNFGDSLNVNVQLFGQWIPNYHSPYELSDPISTAVARVQSAINNQPGRHQYGMTYRIAKSWLNESWQAELSGLHSITTHGNFVRGQIRHAIDDKWRLNLGIEHYSGSDDTVFGQLRANSTAYTELRYAF